MTDQPDKLTPEELEALSAEEVPERAVMSLISGPKPIGVVPVPPHPWPVHPTDPVAQPGPIVEGQA